MTKEELQAWALSHGWQMIAGYPSLTKPSSPNEAIVRLVLKGSVVNLEAKKPAGQWQKLFGAPYGQVTLDEDGDLPRGLGLETIPGFTMLMRQNKDRQAFAAMGGPPAPRR